MELQDTLDDLRDELEVEARRVGAGGDANEGDGRLKESLIAAYKREGLVYDSLDESRAGDDGKIGRDFTTMRSKIWDTIGSVGEVVGSIDGRVAAAAVKLRAKIRKEAQRLVRYEKELSGFESEGREIGREMGEQLFDQSLANMKELVRGADVGLIDVVWQQKRTETDAVGKLQGERAKRISRLDSTLRELTRDRIGGEEPDESEEGSQ